MFSLYSLISKSIRYAIKMHQFIQYFHLAEVNKLILLSNFDWISYIKMLKLYRCSTRFLYHIVILKQ